MLRRFTSDRIRKAHRRRLAVRVAITTTLALSLLFLIVSLVSMRQLAVARIRFEGNHAVSDQELFETLSPYLDGSYGYLFPKRNAFLAPRDAMAAAALASFVRIDRATVSRTGLTTLTVNVHEREPDARWCGDDPIIGTACYFVDDTALAYAPAAQTNGHAFVVYEKKLPADPIGAPLTNEAHFKEIKELIKSLAALGFNVQTVRWSEDALDLVTNYRALSGAQSVTLRVPMTGPYDTAFDNLASIVQTNQKDGTFDFSFAGLDYVDLRFENKVFYKEGGAPSAPAATTTE